MTQINSEFDVAKRKQLIHDLIQIQRDDAIALFLYEAQDLDAISNKLRSLTQGTATFECVIAGSIISH